jgi:malonyl-CoA O-methyltransferase
MYMSSRQIPPPPIKRIASAFGRKTATYDTNARIQIELIRLLAARLVTFNKLYGRWIDCGCGTGLFARECLSAGIRSRIIGIDFTFEPLLAATKLSAASTVTVQADIERLPFKNSMVDGAIIASTLQWLVDPSSALCAIATLLKPHGFLAFSVFTAGSFRELVCLQQQFGIPVPIYCPETDEFLEMARTAGFQDIIFEPVRKTLLYPTATAAIKSVSAIGGTATAGKLLQRKSLLEFCNAYDSRFRTSEGVPLTCQAIVGVCRKGPCL